MAGAALLAGLPLGLGACGDLEHPTPARVRAAIVEGEPSPAGLEDAVLLLRATIPDVGERLCGASLVAENLVVTARHCVAFVTEGPFRCTTSGELVEGLPGAGRMGLDLPGDALEFFTNDVPRTDPVAVGSEVVSTLSNSACSNDLAFVVLDRPLSLPILALRRGRPAREGEGVIAVGYGAERSAGEVLDFETQERRRKAELAIAGVGPDTALEPTNVPPRTIVLEGPSACLGDSGGPLLAEETKALVGIHSLIEGECAVPETRSFFTHLPPLWPWVERAFEAAGTTPTLEPEPPAPCADAGECAGAGGEHPGGATGSAGENAGGAGGASGAPSDPTDPKPPSPRAAHSGRDSGCTLGRRDSSLAEVLATLLLVLFARGSRRGFSACRRGDRLRAAGSE